MSLDGPNFSNKNLIVSLEVWAGAPSCKKISWSNLFSQCSHEHCHCCLSTERLRHHTFLQYSSLCFPKTSRCQYFFTLTAKAVISWWVSSSFSILGPLLDFIIPPIYGFTARGLTVSTGRHVQSLELLGNTQVSEVRDQRYNLDIRIVLTIRHETTWRYGSRLSLAVEIIKSLRIPNYSFKVTVQCTNNFPNYLVGTECSVL